MSNNVDIEGFKVLRVLIPIMCLSIVIIFISGIVSQTFKEHSKYKYETDIIVAKENTKQDSLKLLQYKYLSKQSLVLESYEQANKLRNNK